jgi:hypothetical protein
MYQFKFSDIMDLKTKYEKVYDAYRKDCLQVAKFLSTHNIKFKVVNDPNNPPGIMVDEEAIPEELKKSYLEARDKSWTENILTVYKELGIEEIPDKPKSGLILSPFES